ncbi:hypothetical protein NCAST_35_00890 [Nocardia asteroides NBRC 15531]|uniref:Uncharacterized protein n=2 Tax=Nocardia asteroides TaxID=1824 RepID=U5EME9_NOCAS|nr:hypothetical protein NCAST_35_00890 [Nocardia asteroides NBRC 15531]SFM53260.1 hypothetical protein SAMN05444423_103290 [Nocardia asteroides]VEG33368.1 Uncharacterised protein [Nocardia asteroides]
MRKRLSIVLTATAIAAVSCGSQVDGLPMPTETPVDLTKLSLGSYSPEPYRYELSIVAKAKDVRDLEAKRMLNYLTSATDIDPETNTLAAVETYTDPDGPFATPALPESLREPITSNSLLAGAYVARTDGDPRSPRRLILSVLRFSTVDKANSASTGIAQALRKEDAHSISVDGRPDVSAFSTNWSSGTAVVQRGVYTVLISYGRADPDQQAITANLSKAVNLQLTKLEGLRPTPWEDVLDTPVDPDQIMRRALGSENPKFPFAIEPDFGAFSPDGHLHYERNSALLQRAYAESRTDLIGRRFGIVYRTKDVAGSFHLQSALATLGKRDQELPAPPLLADARCVQLYEPDPVRKYDLMCAIIRGRYVGVVTANTKLSGQVDPVLYERAAAQYAILSKFE